MDSVATDTLALNVKEHVAGGVTFDQPDTPFFSSEFDRCRFHRFTRLHVFGMEVEVANAKAKIARLGRCTGHGGVSGHLRAE